MHTQMTMCVCVRKNASTCDSTHCITYSFVDLERFFKVLSRVCIPFQHPILSFGMSQFTLFRRYCSAIVINCLESLAGDLIGNSDSGASLIFWHVHNAMMDALRNGTMR